MALGMTSSVAMAHPTWYLATSVCGKPDGRDVRSTANQQLRGLRREAALLQRGSGRPNIQDRSLGITTPTSHIDLIPTLMGLAGIGLEKAAVRFAAHHDEAHPLPGRDLSGVITGSNSAASISPPICFMTEDEFSRGISETNMFSALSAIRRRLNRSLLHCPRGRTGQMSCGTSITTSNGWTTGTPSTEPAIRPDPVSPLPLRLTFDPPDPARTIQPQEGDERGMTTLFALAEPKMRLGRIY